MERSGLPEPISRLIDELSKLPGIGEKNATRLAFHIFRSSENYAKSLANAIVRTKSDVITCDTCFNFTSSNPCGICSSQSRSSDEICVVEDPLDLLAVEKSREFKGKYHVLQGKISPLEGIGPEDLKINELIERVKNSDVNEIIVATNTDVEGEATAMYLAKMIKPFNVRVSRIAHGIPMGGDIEYIDELTLGKALKDRRDI